MYQPPANEYVRVEPEVVTMFMFRHGQSECVWRLGRCNGDLEGASHGF